MFKMRPMAALVIAVAGLALVQAQAAPGDEAPAPAQKKAKKAKKAAKADANQPKPAAFMVGERAYGIGPRGFGEITGGRLEDNLALLASYKKPPEVMFKLYEAAYKALAAKPDATFMDVANDPDVRKICKDNGIDALGGPMLGSVASDGASVWVRTARPAKVEVQVAIVGGPDKTFGPVAATAESDLSAVVKITGLAPATTYAYRVLVDGKALPVPDGGKAELTTAPEPGAGGKVRIVFGSCFHRFGLGNDMQARAILARKPTAMLIYGDCAVQDRESNYGMHRADFLLRDMRPAWKMITSSVPVYDTWDDHDYFNNDKAGVPKNHTDADRRGVRAVFTKAWANPSYGLGDEGGGIFFHTRIGPADVIMLDNRYFRLNEKGSFLGPEQTQWLKAELLACKGSFILMSCGTMWSDYITPGKDSWGVWDPNGREDLFNFIEANRIGGVVLLSGDRHGARGFTIPRPSGFKFYEFEPGSLGGWRGPDTQAKDGANQLFGLARRFMFGELTIDGKGPDATAEFRLIGDDGEIIYETKLTKSQLTPGGKSK